MAHSMTPRDRLKPLLVPDTLHHRIKLEAVRRGIKIQEITEAAMEAWLRQKQPAGTTEARR